MKDGSKVICKSIKSPHAIIIYTLSTQKALGPRAFWSFNWGIICFRTSSWITGFSTNKFNKELKRKLLTFFLDWGMVLDQLGPTYVKTLLKALAMFLGFVKSFPITIFILGCPLLSLYFNVIRCRILFQSKDVSFLFFQK